VKGIGFAALTAGSVFFYFIFWKEFFYMMLDELIRSENTDSQFKKWTHYREKLTSIIENLIIQNSRAVYKPTLAIWGAGGCNDIDIGRLSDIAKLVLIDNQKKLTENAITKYGLNKSQAIASDLFFYDIPYESYEHWEELLYKGASVDVLHGFLSELLLEAVSTDMLMLPEFDYSAAIGISSQLNSRLAALLYLYRNNYSITEREDILRHLAIMDRFAVNRLYEIVSQTTKIKTVWGYEDKTLESDDILSNVEGNKRLHELLNCHSTEAVSSESNLIWPFSDKKTYQMKIIVT
jgi:hypothetical protein